MADYNNSGALWKRQPKEDDKPGVKYPHYIGKFTDANGKQWDLASWLNVDKKKDTQPDISIKVSEPYKKDANQTKADFL